MEAYTDFAYVYDIFMDETPYDKWRDFIIETIKKYGISGPVRLSEAMEESGLTGKKGTDKRQGMPEEADSLKEERNLILDLGCGTGTLTELLAEAGYDMIGVDSSADMLELAMEKRDSMGHGTLYLLQDMRELELYGTVGTVVSVCDSLNYILSEEELLQVFKLVENYLFPEGIFIFDFNTVYKYAEVIGDTTIAENREDCSFIWENTYYPEEALNEYEVTVFVRDGFTGRAGEDRQSVEEWTENGQPEEQAEKGRTENGQPEEQAEKGRTEDGQPEEGQKKNRRTGEGQKKEGQETEEQESRYRRFSEVHYQRGYTEEQMRRLLEMAGMKIELVLDADTLGEATDTSGRIYMVARCVKGRSGKLP